MRKRFFSGLLLIILLVSGCGVDIPKQDVVVSVFALESIYKDIAGKTLKIKSIYPNGIDAHEYELTGKDIQQILESDNFTYISNNFETYAKQIRNEKEKKNSKLNILDISQTQEIKSSINKNNFIDNDLNDPHLWISPQKALLLSNIIYKQLITKYSQNKNIYQKNYQKLQIKLKKLDQEYRKFGKQNHQPIYVSHDAYYWLRKDYNINIIGMYGSDHDDEPTSKDFEKAISEIKNNKIKTVYTEENDLNNPAIKQIAQNSNIKIKTLNNLEVKTSNQENYLKKLQNNIDVMKEDV